MQLKRQVERGAASHDAAAGSLADWNRRVEAIRRYITRHGGTRWGLYASNTFTFGCAFSALLAENRMPVLLPHAQPGMLDEARRTLDALLLPETLSLWADPALEAEGTARLGGDIPWEQHLASPLCFYTSASTGMGTLIEKSLRQLVSEIEALEQTWGKEVGDSVIFATVSHQHIYGFLFSFLWPLLTGRRFWSKPQLLPNELQRGMERVEKATLISCPSHLDRMADLVDMQVIRRRCSLIFSSGAPLSQETAWRLAHEWKQPPIEVFGSTETGGVGWRQQSPGHPQMPWTPLPGVAVRTDTEDGPLMVRSPFALADFDACSGWVTMGDRARIGPAGTFTVLGRVDRIAKIQQKRVSLSGMENLLKEHPFVKICAVVLLPEREGYRRDWLGAAVVLSREGRTFQAAESRPALIRILRQHLLSHFEPVTLPRRWVMVETLPENSQGKRTEPGLQALFDRPAAQAPRMPTVLHETVHADTYCMQGRVPETLRYLDGHFDGFPVVAGVVQLHWVMHYAQSHFGISPEVAQMRAIKFQRVLMPLDEFTLHIRYERPRNLVRFSITSHDHRCSSGQFFLAPSSG